MTMRRVVELANIVELQREQGGNAAGLRLEVGVDKSGLDTLRSFIDREINELSDSLIMVQRRSSNYQEIVAYCVLFGAFWLYLSILLLARQPRGEE
jgi:hypothetical protein